MVARRLRERAPEDVEVRELEGEPVTLVEAWNGAGSVFVVDAVKSGSRPGTVHRLDATDEPLPATLSAASTHSSTTCLCSSWLRVGHSPVVPTGTRPCVPSSICHSTRRVKASSSILPFLNGVMSAVNEPLNMGRASASRRLEDPSPP